MLMEPVPSTTIESSSTDEWQKFEPLHRRVADFLNVNVNTEWSKSRQQLRIGLLMFSVRLTTRSNTSKKARDDAYDVAIMDGMRARKCTSLAKETGVLQI